MIRGFDLRRALTANWPYKVAAIVLSILLWLRVSAGQARVEQSVPTRLQIEVADTAWSLLDARTEVMTIFQGRGGDMFSFSVFQQPRIRKVIDSVEDTIVTLPLSVSDVIYNRSLNVTPTSVDPSEVRVRLERRASRMVAVEVETDARAGPGFFRGEVRATPDSVELRGPASLVSSIPSVSTEPFEVGELTGRVSRQLAVRVPAGVSGVEVDPPSVLVSVEVDSLRTRVFQVPLAVTGPHAAGVTVTPAVVQVAVSGGARAVGSLIAPDVLARVQIDEPVTGPRSQRVLVELPDDIAADAEPDPPRARVAPASNGPAAARPPPP